MPRRKTPRRYYRCAECEEYVNTTTDGRPLPDSLLSNLRILCSACAPEDAPRAKAPPREAL